MESCALKPKIQESGQAVNSYFAGGVWGCGTGQMSQDSPSHDGCPHLPSICCLSAEISRSNDLGFLELLLHHQNQLVINLV